MVATQQYCTFFLDGLFFGVDVQHVQEVIRYQEMTRVPLAARVVSGLINLRGQIVTAIDLRRRLQLPERDSGKLPMNIIVRSDDGIVSLQADEIGDVQEVAADQFESTPNTLQDSVRNLIRGVYKLDGRLLLVLDTERVTQIPPETQAEAA